MTEGEFRRLAAAYGGDLARWPELRREEAAALMRRAPQLGAVLHAELAFDERVRTAAPDVTWQRADAVMEGVAGAIARSQGAAASRQPQLRRAVPFAFAVCALAGFALGFLVSSGIFQADPPQDVFAFLAADGGAPAFLSR
jgi:hypothetical protein